MEQFPRFPVIGAGDGGVSSVLPGEMSPARKMTSTERIRMQQRRRQVEAAMRPGGGSMAPASPYDGPFPRLAQRFGM